MRLVSVSANFLPLSGFILSFQFSKCVTILPVPIPSHCATQTADPLASLVCLVIGNIACEGGKEAVPFLQGARGSELRLRGLSRLTQLRP